MPKTYKQPKPVYAKEPDSRYEESRKHMLASYQKANYSYTADSYQERRHDIIERMNIDLQRQYSDLVTETLVSVQRVLLPYSRMFELSNGGLDTKYKVKSALVYKVTVEIESENAKKAGYHKIMDINETGAGSHTFTIGRYQRPIIEPTSYDRNGNVTNARIKAYYYTYFLPDTEAKIKSIFKHYNQKPLQGCICCIANIQGAPYSSSFALVDESEFLTADIEDIINGNRLGLPVRAYREWEGRKQKLIAGGVGTKQQLDKLTDSDFVKMISDKEKGQDKK